MDWRSRIRDPRSGIRYPGSEMEKKDPGSGINIPDPQHWEKQLQVHLPPPDEYRVASDKARLGTAWASNQVNYNIIGACVADLEWLSRIGIFSIPDPGSASKNLSILTQKLFLSSRKHDPGCSSRIRILIFYPSRIPGLKSHRISDPQNWLVLTSMLEFLEERGLATVTSGKKSRSWLYSKLTSFPLIKRSIPIIMTPESKNMDRAYQYCGSGSVCFGPPGSGSVSQRYGSASLPSINKQK